MPSEPAPDDVALVEALVRRAGGGRVWRAPGRVNIVGEHVDYTGGLVLPFAFDRRVYLAAELSQGAVVLESLEQGRTVVPLDARPAQIQGWGRYVAGVVGALREAGLPVRAVRGALTSTIPAGAGLASSAALEAAIALAVLGGQRPDPGVLQRAEHLAVGVPCGIMDQVATLHAQAGHAILLDCAAVNWQQVPIPGLVEFLVVDTGTRRTLEDGRYALRRAEAEAGVWAAREQLGVASPRELRPADVQALRLSGLERRRLRHVVTENVRVEVAAAALRAGDGAALGAIVDESHRSLRDDFEVSSSALDAAVEALRSAPGCLGARLVGGGFAGCVLAVVAAGAGRDVWSYASARLPGAAPIPVSAVGGADELAS